MDDNILEVNDLKVKFHTYAGVVKALKGINFEVKKGETFGIVGETGCGKSVTALSILGLVPTPGEIDGGQIIFKRDDKQDNLIELDDEELRRIRGNEISMIFQEPSDALNPVFSIGDQIGEAFLSHRKKELIDSVLENIDSELANETNPLKRLVLSVEGSLYTRMKENDNSFLDEFFSKIPLLNKYRERLDVETEKRVIDILNSVGIPDPEDVVDKYPYEMSGGMNQRAVIASALACRPQLLIADEPTSNLDVSIQAQILDIIDGLQEKFGVSVLHITHNLGVIAQDCDRVGVMYAGRIVEIAEVEELFENPIHPYTRKLFRSVPSPEKEKLETVEGSVPDLISPPPGCRFNPRCPFSSSECEQSSPIMEEIEKDHYVSCHKLDEIYETDELSKPM